jgi:hypothetical protein
LHKSLVSSKEKEEVLVDQIKQNDLSPRPRDQDEDDEKSELNKLADKFNDFISQNNEYMSIIDNAIQDAEFWRTKYNENCIEQSPELES